MRAESARSAPRARRAGKKGSRVGDRSFSKSVTIRTGQFSTRGTGHSSRCPLDCSGASNQDMDDHGSILCPRCNRRVLCEIFIRCGGLHHDCARTSTWPKQTKDVPSSACSQEHVISFVASGVTVSEDHKLQCLVCFEAMELSHQQSIMQCRSLDVPPIDTEVAYKKKLA
jgi:hypothetical protein